MRFGLLQLRRVLNNKIASEFPTGTGYIASYTDKYLPEVQTILEVDPKKIIDKKPDIIGISSVTATFNQAIEFSKYIKENSDIPIIIGGHHISSLPDTLPKTINIGVKGEGEETIVDLLKIYKKYKEFPQEILSKTNGIIYHSKDGIKITPNRNYIQTLDDIPPPRVDIRLIQEQNLEPALITSRGCPYDCSFCYTGEFWRKVRYHSVERVIEEITDIVRNYPEQETIRIYDDIFAINKSRLKTIVDVIKSEKINKKVNFTCFARASIFDEEICLLLKEMNMKFVDFGFESGNQRILKYLKGHAKLPQNQKAMDISRKYGLNVRGAFIIGSPPETIEEASNTYWFVRNNKDAISSFTICPATPLPGTHLWDDCISQNIIDKNNINWDYMHGDYEYGKTIHINTNYSESDVHNIMNEFSKIKLYYEKPSKDIILDNYTKHLYKKVNKIINEFKLGKFYDISNIREDLKLEIENKKISFKDNKNINGIISIHNIDYDKNLNNIFELSMNEFKNSKEIIFSFYNSKHISQFIDLCTGEWLSDKEHIYNSSKYNLLTLEFILNLINKNNFNLKYLEPIRIKTKAFDNFKSEFIEILKNHNLHNSIIQDLDTISYLVLIGKL